MDYGVKLEWRPKGRYEQGTLCVYMKFSNSFKNKNN